MHGRKEFKSDPSLKNVGYAEQLKDNRAEKKCWKKNFYFILTVILIVFLVRKLTSHHKFLRLPLI